ncbi:MAG: hypothetical protein MK074_00155 [Phycisphaerales bacterium]|nr:hypothetical protein [Phycisphaerales bacterium]
MDFGDLIYVLILVSAGLGPLLKGLKGKAAAGQGKKTMAPTGPGRSSIRPRPAAKPVARQQQPPQAATPAQTGTTVRSRPIQPAKAAKTPPPPGAAPQATASASEPAPDQATSQGDTHGDRLAAFAHTHHSGPSERRVWTTLQQAVVLQAMLDKPRGLKPHDSIG